MHQVNILGVNEVRQQLIQKLEVELSSDTIGVFGVGCRPL